MRMGMRRWREWPWKLCLPQRTKSHSTPPVTGRRSSPVATVQNGLSYSQSGWRWTPASHHIPFSGKSHCIEDIALQQHLMSGQQNQPVAQDKNSHTPAKADPPPVHKRAHRSTGMPLCFLNAVCFCISTAHLNNLPGPKWVFYEQKSWLLPQKKKRISVIICVADAQRAGHASSFKQRKSISVLLLSRSQSKFKRCRPGEISGGNGSLTPAICPYLEFECTSSRCLLGIF